MTPNSPSKSGPFSRLIHKIAALPWILDVVIVALIIGLGYAFYIHNDTTRRIDALTHDIATLQTNVASTTKLAQDLQIALGQTQTTLANTISDQRTNEGSLQSQLGTYQQQVGNITGTLTTLQKLSRTDPQLLQKYSKVYFLNENYAPAELTQIPDIYLYSLTKHPLISTPVWPFLNRMLDAASSSDIKLYVSSGYRSFNEQSSLKNEYKVVYGAGTANSFSADQGYSEHQLGTAIDFITTGTGGQLDGFDKTSAYQWMLDNAYMYGFVLSYPKNNPYYVYEPWHWRFVGVKLATYLHSTNQYFYDLDQRTIDTYLVNLFD